MNGKRAFISQRFDELHTNNFRTISNMIIDI